MNWKLNSPSYSSQVSLLLWSVQLLVCSVQWKCFESSSIYSLPSQLCPDFHGSEFRTQFYTAADIFFTLPRLDSALHRFKGVQRWHLLRTNLNNTCLCSNLLLITMQLCSILLKLQLLCSCLLRFAAALQTLTLQFTAALLRPPRHWSMSGIIVQKWDSRPPQNYCVRAGGYCRTTGRAPDPILETWGHHPLLTTHRVSWEMAFLKGESSHQC